MKLIFVMQLTIGPKALGWLNETSVELFTV